MINQGSGGAWDGINLTGTEEYVQRNECPAIRLYSVSGNAVALRGVPCTRKNVSTFGLSKDRPCGRSTAAVGQSLALTNVNSPAPDVTRRQWQTVFQAPILSKPRVVHRRIADTRRKERNFGAGGGWLGRIEALALVSVESAARIQSVLTMVLS